MLAYDFLSLSAYLNEKSSPVGQLLAALPAINYWGGTVFPEVYAYGAVQQYNSIRAVDQPSKTHRLSDKSVASTG